MRKPIVAGNWKMHGNKSFVADLLSEIKAGINDLSQVDVIVFPPYIFLESVQQILSGSPLHWGGQNVYQADEGAFTGEISPAMLEEFGCSYVIVGHSERRHLLGETNNQVAEKFQKAQQFGLTPILCVGETREEREVGQTFKIIATQLQPILEHKNIKELLRNAVIAYEPVWAIGTGLTATPEQAQEVHQFIRNEVTKIDKSLAEKLRILYGGSVKQSNASALFSMPDIDGGLIGGASLNAKEFLEIAKLCNSY